jgi:BolA family transcriptional regulator, general stress-responsive regulator
MSVQATIQQRVTTELSPVHLEVINESHNHRVPENAETHFKLIIASDGFSKLNLVQRHQRIYQLLSDLLQNPIHALSIHAYTAAEWNQQQAVPASPNCHNKKVPKQ